MGIFTICNGKIPGSLVSLITPKHRIPAIHLFPVKSIPADAEIYLFPVRSTLLLKMYKQICLIHDKISLLSFYDKYTRSILIFQSFSHVQSILFQNA